VIALTGIAHLLGGFELDVQSGRRRRPGVPSGILEIGLGATLVLTADRHDSLSTWLAGAWALLGGAVLLSDALLMRRRLPAHPDDRAGSSSEVVS
jgi:drug/metabolite transporter (DMT)-like permease